MKRTMLVLSMFLLATLISGWVNSAEPQQRAKVPLVGYLSNDESPRDLKQGLRELGYVHGQNIAVVALGAYGERERYPEFAEELVNYEVDVIVAVGSGAARAAKEATTTIPIVVVTGTNPQWQELVASLAQPGGNVTGFSEFSTKLGGKRLELLKEAVPSVSRVGILREAGWSESRYRQIVTAAEALGVEHHSIEVQSSNPDFDGAFEAAMKRRVDAFVVMQPTVFNRHRARILELVAKTQLPAMYEHISWVRRGGLMFYGARRRTLIRRTATYVDKILKGAKPGNLPVEGPTKFELVINLKTAKKIGITIPPEVLFRADKIIRSQGPQRKGKKAKKTKRENS